MFDGKSFIIIGYVALVIAVFLVIFLIIYHKVLDYNANSSVEFSFGVLITFLTIVTIVTIMLLCIGYYSKEEYYKSYDNVIYEKIESVDRSYDIEGHFGLYSGHIESNIAYYFYVETKHGYELKHVTANDDVRIFLVEDNSQTPHVIEKKEEGQYPYIQIIVPTGTVVKEYRG